MSDRTFNAEEWRMAESMVRHGVSRDFVIRLILVCNKNSWICPVNQCHQIYGYKQHLGRHLGKVHPNEPENSGIDKSNGNHMEKLVTILGKDVEGPPVVIFGSDTSIQTHLPVNAPQLSGLSPHGSSPGYFDTHPTPSPSSDNGAVIKAEPSPAASGNLLAGADNYGASPNSQAPHNPTAGPWNTSGTESVAQIPYEQSYHQVEPSGPWNSNIVNYMDPNESMTSNLTTTSFNAQSTELDFSGPILTDQEYPSTYDPQQQYQYQHQNENQMQIQNQNQIPNQNQMHNQNQVQNQNQIHNQSQIQNQNQIHNENQVHNQNQMHNENQIQTQQQYQQQYY